MVIEWKFVDKGELPEHGKQVRVVRNFGYVGVDHYSRKDKEWVFNNDVICWHELLAPPEQ